MYDAITESSRVTFPTALSSIPRERTSPVCTEDVPVGHELFSREFAGGRFVGGGFAVDRGRIDDGAVVDATAHGGVAIGQQSHSAAGEVNIGNRQITGVAAGKAGTDAVNVSQLAAVTTQLTTLINNQSRGGGGAPFSSTPGSSPASTGPNSSAGGQGSVASDSNSTVYR